MSPSRSSFLSFVSQISDNLQQLTQLTSAHGAAPTPPQELQILRSFCGAYDKIFAHLASIPTHSPPVEKLAIMRFVLQTLPLMQNSARALAAFEDKPDRAPLLAASRELLGRLNEGISGLKQRYRPITG